MGWSRSGVRLGALALVVSSLLASAGVSSDAWAKAAGAVKTMAAHRDPVDFTGVWFPYQPEGFDFLPAPELTPAADKVFQAQMAEQAQGRVPNDSSGRCIPSGLPRLLNRVYPSQIVRTPKDIITIHEYESQLRFIHMDGRQHPRGDDLIPSFNGNSIGHWEGKTLVVDTVGFRTEVAGWPTQPQNGVRITADFHLVERWTLSEGGKLLTDDMVMTDPTVFAKPWKTMKRFKRRDDLELMEFTCLPEENPISLDATGRDVFTKPGSAAAPR